VFATTPFGPIVDGLLPGCVCFFFLVVLALVLVVVIGTTGSPDRGPWKRSRRDDEPPDSE
jgi:hypothetical protein